MANPYVRTKDFFIEKYTLKTPMSEMHFHNSHELYYLIKGSREYFIGDGFYNVREGDLVSVPAGVLHRTAGKGATRILVFFSDGFLGRFFSAEITSRLSAALSEPVLRLPDPDSEWVYGRLTLLLREYDQQRQGLRPRDDAVLAMGLVHILWHLCECRSVYSEEAEADSRITDIVRFVNENYGTIASIDEVADKFYLSKYYLCQLFRKNMGVTLFTYLNTVKIRAACAMINCGGLTMTEISGQCGFNTASYFCKVFRSVMGVSPSEYKKSREPRQEREKEENGLPEG